jgi:hypothetical protein
MMFLDCPADLDQEDAARCGLPAEVRCRFTMSSADGPVESAMIRCPAGHHFSGPIESLTWDRDGWLARRDFPGSPRRHARRPNSAPAYYLGRPACQWITMTRPRRWLAIGARAR